MVFGSKSRDRNMTDEPLTAAEQRRAEFIKTTDALARCALEASPNFRAKARGLIWRATLDYLAIWRRRDA
jgi:hypothetical protein